MTEMLMHPVQEPTPDEQWADLESQISAIRGQYSRDEAGGNSFYDVTGNLGAVIKSGLGYYNEMKGSDDPEDAEEAEEALKDAEGDLAVLADYMKVINAHPDIKEKELANHDGALPEARREADEKTATGEVKRPIVYYVGQLAAKAEQRK